MASDPKKQEQCNFTCKNNVNIMGMHIYMLLLGANEILFLLPQIK